MCKVTSHSTSLACSTTLAMANFYVSLMKGCTLPFKICLLYSVMLAGSLTTWACMGSGGGKREEEVAAAIVLVEVDTFDGWLTYTISTVLNQILKLRCDGLQSFNTVAMFDMAIDCLNPRLGPITWLFNLRNNTSALLAKLSNLLY